MNKEFVPYQPSLDMKELGFDEPCFVKIWWLNDFNVHTKEQFKPHITMNGDDIKFKYQFPENHPLNKGDILKLEIPTFSQAFRWLLKHHNLYGVIIPTETMNWTFKTMTVVEGIVEVPPYKHVDSNDYGTPEEAEFACLIKLIEIVKNK